MYYMFLNNSATITKKIPLLPVMLFGTYLLKKKKMEENMMTTDKNNDYTRNLC